MPAPTRRDAVEEARRLFVEEGMGYEEAAEATGLSASTLQKRGATEDWTGQRKHAMTYSAQIKAAKVAALKRFTDALSNSAATADEIAKFASVWKSAEMAFPEHRYSATKNDPRVRLAIIGEVLEYIAEYLVKVDRSLAAKMAAHIDQIAKDLEERNAAN